MLLSMKTTALIIYFIYLIILPVYGASKEDYSRYVDPFIGVSDGGNVFPGVSLPNALVKLGPDCGEKVWNAGWDPSGNILGFSHVHVSGTGGGCKYGNVLVAPCFGDLDVFNYGYKRKNEKSEIGLYSVQLGENSDISVRLSSTERVGIHEYTFSNKKEGHILFDLGSFLWFKLCKPESQEFVGSEVRILSNREVEGYTRIRGGWNMGEEYTVYFHAVFDRDAIEFGTWKKDIVSANKREEYDSGDKTGAYFTFNTTDSSIIRLKVGISFVSVGKAKENLKETSSFDIDYYKEKSKEKWNRILGKIQINKGNKEDKIKFYSSLYRAYLQPTNKIGENSKWKSDRPYYDDFYAIWDTYRATNPLYTLITPELEVDVINSLLNIYEKEGYMPDARSGDSNGRVQAGSNADVLIADAIVKGLKGIDYNLALKAMIKSAEVSPGGDERQVGRGGLSDYNTLNYISTRYERAGSRTMEYAFNDYCIALVAHKLGENKVYEIYKNKANNWKNLWNKNWKEKDFVGFICPRKPDGAWEKNFSVYSMGGWTDFFYESHSWEMSMFVPHDIVGLINICGGKELFEKRLDYIFENNLWNVSNEPGFMLPHLYNYINKPHKAAKIIRETLSNKYGIGYGGLPGNDDSGSMAAWYIFNSLGFYPNAGQDIYLFTSPIFKDVRILLSEGKYLDIKVKNASRENIYIQDVMLNNKRIFNTWINHEDLLGGGELKFIMGDKPSSWGENNVIPNSFNFK